MELMKQIMRVTHVGFRFRILNWYMAGFLTGVGPILVFCMHVFIR